MSKKHSSNQAKRKRKNNLIRQHNAEKTARSKQLRILSKNNKSGLPIASVSTLITKATDLITELESKLLCISELILLSMELKEKEHPKKEEFKLKLMTLSSLILELKSYLEQFNGIEITEINKLYPGTTIEGQNIFFKLASYITDIQVKMQSLQEIYKDPLMTEFIDEINKSGIPKEVIEHVVNITNELQNQIEQTSSELPITTESEQEPVINIPSESISEQPSVELSIEPLSENTTIDNNTQEESVDINIPKF
jgi:hypothetical protein